MEPTSPPLAVAAVVRDRSGRYLVIRRAEGVSAPGYWTPVTGRPEPGERLEDTVVRECHEEVGLSVTVGEELYRCHTADRRWLLVWFDVALRDPGAPSLTLLPSEVAEARWLTAREVLDLSPMFPATRYFFEQRAGALPG